MTGDQFKALRPGSVLCGFNKSHFTVTVETVHEDGSMTLRGAGGARRWTKSHVKKYYWLPPVAKPSNPNLAKPDADY